MRYFLETMRKRLERAESQSSIPILKSKFTPGLKNGKGVCFSIGDVVEYRCSNGTTLECTIDSEYMENEDYYGYEAIFHDDGERYFAIDEWICDWEGRC